MDCGMPESRNRGPCFAMTAEIGLTEAGGVSMLVLSNKFEKPEDRSPNGNNRNRNRDRCRNRKKYEMKRIDLNFDPDSDFDFEEKGSRI